MNLESICKQTIPLVAEVGQFIHGEIRKVGSGQIDFKARNSLVSYVDKEAEKKLVNGLSQILPDAVFFTEEETVTQSSGQVRWIIDPLDGTTNYLHQLPCYSISVALEIDKNLVGGIIYDIPENDVFIAWQNGGAWLNEERIRVSETQSLSESLIATGFPYHAYEYLEEYIDIFKTLIRTSRGVRRFGSAAIDLAYTACGRFDGFFEYSLNLWDIAAGVVIMKEAGGIVTSFSGDDQYAEKQTLVTANPQIHQEILDIIQEHDAFV